MSRAAWIRSLLGIPVDGSRRPGRPVEVQRRRCILQVERLEDRLVPAPMVTASGTVDYTLGGPAAVVDSTATVTDGNTNLVGATVSITAGFDSHDVLNFTNQADISGTK